MIYLILNDGNGKRRPRGQSVMQIPNEYSQEEGLSIAVQAYLDKYNIADEDRSNYFAEYIDDERTFPNYKD